MEEDDVDDEYKTINTFRGHKAGSLNVNLGGIYSYHYVLKAQICAKEWDRDTVI